MEGKKVNRKKEGCIFTVLITYKYPFMVNSQLVTVSLDLGEGVACNNIFSGSFLHTIEASILTNNNALVIGIPGKQLKLEMMVPKKPKEAPKTP